MAVAPFDKAAEDRLVGAVRECMASITDDGVSPDDAIVKVATDHRLPSTYIPLLVRSFNVGRSAYQREQNTGVLEKLAEFPIARIENIMARLYPEKIASAEPALSVSDEYDRPPDPWPESSTGVWSTKLPSLLTEKEAACANKKPAAKKQPMKAITKAKQAYEYASSVAARFTDNFRESVKEMNDYFRKSSIARLQTPEVEYYACQLFGPPAKLAMDIAYASNEYLELRKAAFKPRLTAVAETQEPYNLIHNVIKCAQAVNKAEAEKRHCKMAMFNVAEDELRPFVLSPSHAEICSSVFQDSSTMKEANFFPALMGGMTAGVANWGRQTGADKTPGEMSSSIADELATPGDQNEIRQIYARAMLQDFLDNDEVISSHEPDEVLSAYNEIAQLGQHVSSQPAIMRPLLRQRLTQGAVAPFEAEQIANIEKTMRQTEAIGLDRTKGAEVLHDDSIFV